MPERPLLILGRPTPADRDPGRRGMGPRINFPGSRRQGQRITPRLEALERSMEARRLRLQADAAGAEIEQVVVFETVGTIESFLKAVERIPGLEWLAEFEEEDIPADEDFRWTAAKDAGEPLEGTLYLVLENAQGLQQLLALWNRYQRQPDAAFARGLAPIKNLFKQLKDVRRWDAVDRVRETGIEQNWREQIELGNQAIRFEVDLWFRESAEARARVSGTFRRAITQIGGQVVHESTIPEIRYQGVLVEIPSAPVQEVLNHFDALLLLPETNFIRAQEVMFFRPLPQCSIPIDEEAAPEGSPALPTTPLASLAPIIALLDGLPLANHHRLAGRLIIDDPDNWEQDYLAEHRQHGSAMASLILHGDLKGEGRALGRPVYVRPIMRAVQRGGSWREETPLDNLPIDLTYRALRRMFEGDGGLPPQAPTIRIVNFSIGDGARPFLHDLSPWARLLDWAAHRYNILINVSCGNHADLSLPLSLPQLNALSVEDRCVHVFRHVFSNARHRRILSPAEAVNALCVGATHEDHASTVSIGYRADVCPHGFPSPLNALNGGYRRGIKPDLLLPGGRQLFTPVMQGAQIRLDPLLHKISPGQLVAMPGPGGALNAEGYVRGSSNSTALATRSAGLLCEMAAELRAAAGDAQLPESATAVLLKALLVHGASWPDAWRALSSILPEGYTEGQIRKLMMQLSGYGKFDLSRVIECTAQRATLFGCGILAPEQGHVYRVPLPPSLNATIEFRRLIITLAWLTPLNQRHRNYRGAVLWFDPPTDPLQVNRCAADHNAVRRGTVQHEILDGRRAVAVADGDALEIKVNCREDAGGFDGMEIPYAVAITLEASVNSTLPIYEEIRTRIHPAVRVVPEIGR